jgi:hypothetical protein
MAEHSPMMCGDIAGRGACLQSRDTIPRDPPNTPRGDPFSSRHGEEWSMRNMMLTVGALLLATAVGGCATYPTYGYGYGPAYGYVPNAYGVYPYNYAYRDPPIMPIGIPRFIRRITTATSGRIKATAAGTVDVLPSLQRDPAALMSVARRLTYA